MQEDDYYYIASWFYDWLCVSNITGEVVVFIHAPAGKRCICYTKYTASFDVKENRHLTDVKSGLY